MTGGMERTRPTVEDMKVLAHPLRWRILRLCLDAPWTNQQLAERLDRSPATVLRHVRALAAADFLVAEPMRTGERGAWERPYRATGRTWGLAFLDLDEPELQQDVDLAVLGAHRAELVEAGPGAIRDTARGVLRLRPESIEELSVRITGLLAEYFDRDEPDGESLSYLWSLIRRPEER